MDVRALFWIEIGAVWGCSRGTVQELKTGSGEERWGLSLRAAKENVKEFCSSSSCCRRFGVGGTFGDLALLKN